MKVPRDLRKEARQARRQGWELSVTGSCHIRWQSPDGPVVITPMSPSGGKRSIANCRALLRRAGLRT